MHLINLRIATVEKKTKKKHLCIAVCQKLYGQQSALWPTSKMLRDGKITRDTLIVLWQIFKTTDLPIPIWPVLIILCEKLQNIVTKSLTWEKLGDHSQTGHMQT